VADSFVPSPHVTRGGRREIELVVVHTMEIDERADAAEACARWFADRRARVSAHYCVDADSVVQCVREEDVAWGAPGANANGIHVELAGRAAQTRREWDDAYSRAVLARSAALVAEICERHRLPAVWLSAAELRSRRRGITGHAAVGEAFGRSDHWDPGPAFPASRFVALVRAAREGGAAAGVVAQPL